MNMPNLASCHHFMRRMRSISSADGAFNCAAGGSALENAGSRGTAGDARRGIVLNAVAEAAPISKSRRVIRFRFIVFTLILISALCTPVVAPSEAATLVKRKAAAPGRSEEHTSELQSHSDLVCRLLLE